MSKFISVFHRKPVNTTHAVEKLTRALQKITPDLLQGRSRIETAHAGGHFQGTLNMPGHFPRHGLSLCQGKLLAAAPSWWRPDSGHPDGAYAMIREDARRIEALATAGSTRSLWVYFDEETFAVSNSQRAITIYTGRFAYNPDVAPWLISSGTLGPGHSYNRHLSLMPLGGRALLDKAGWRLRVDEPEVHFHEVERSEADHLDAVQEAICDTLAHFSAHDAATIPLSLSGGCDSRAIANYLHKLHPEVAWSSFSSGPEASPGIAGTDPAVAAEIARAFGFSHRFYVNDTSPEPPEVRLRRFILCSEGRIDHFKAYASGMLLLRTLFDQGIGVAIRGDHGLGGPAVESETAARRTVNFMLCSDVPALSGKLVAFGLDRQRIPENLARRPGESLATWRDRIDHSFYNPTVLSALSETKTAFLDPMAPLLSERILTLSRSLPDTLRNDKRALRLLVKRTGPDLPFAKTSGIAGTSSVLKHPAFRRELETSLASETAIECFGAPFIAWLRREVVWSQSGPYRACKRLVRDIASRRTRRQHAALALYTHPLHLALRVHMATSMTEQLRADAALLSAQPFTAGMPQKCSARGTSAAAAFSALATGDGAGFGFPPRGPE